MMLKKVSQMNRQINSFPNMYDTLKAKFDSLTGKFDFVKKKPENTEIIDNFSDMLTLEGSGRRRNKTRSTLGFLLTNLGYK